MPVRVSDLPHFLNVDLIIRSRTDLEPLVSAMGKRVIVLNVGSENRAYKAYLEISGLAKEPEDVIRAFCKLIRGLPRSARRHWFSAQSRLFDVGVGSVQKGTYWFEISSQTSPSWRI